MKKVISVKRAGLKLLVLAMVGAELLFAACGKKETAVSMPSNTPTIEVPKETMAPSATPVVEEKAVEVVETPIVDSEALESEIIEKQSKEYYTRLTSTESNSYVYPYTYEDVYNLVKIAHGQLEYLRYLQSTSDQITDADIENFNNLDDESQNIIMGELYNRLVLALIGHTNTVIQTGLDIVFEGVETKINNPESYKIFLKADDTYAKGAETLKLLEDTAQKVYDSLGSDWDTFEANAQAYQSLVVALFPEAANVWNNQHLTEFSRINNGMKPYLVVESLGTLAVIFARSQNEGKVITTGENPCFTTESLIADLTEENYTVTAEDIEAAREEGIPITCEIGQRINKYALRISTKLYNDMRNRFGEKFSKEMNNAVLSYTPNPQS